MCLMYTDAYLSIKSFFDKIGRDRIYTFSATAVFFFILSVFPFAILLLTVIQYTPLTQEYLIDRINYALPEIIAPIVSGMVSEIYATTSGATLIFVSAIGAIWSASRGIMAILRGINVCFNTNDKRNYFTVRLLSCFYVFVTFIILLLLFGITAFGQSIYALIKGYLGPLNDVIHFIIVQRYPISIVILTLLFMLVYKYFPAKHNRFFRMLPGALLAAVGWVLLSALLSLYVRYFPNFTYTYGSITAVIVVMLYLYFGMYILFVFAEFNFFMNILFTNWERKRLRDKARRYEEKMATRKLNAQQMKDLLRIREKLGIKKTDPYRVPKDKEVSEETYEKFKE